MMNAAVPQNLANRRMRKLFLAGRSGTWEERDTIPLAWAWRDRPPALRFAKGVGEAANSSSKQRCQRSCDRNLCQLSNMS
ncbi:hypothetical protein RX330_10090 [Bradyrhizobium sp. NDS-1]|uniref:hypothetical protein n=1 Tax=Bradyrhizobium sp. NDS-1 TaxID=3080014 RepID=UPI00293EB8B5|nr:hypothetical protein [Bradyrhizobium sp. NDS-1]WOH75437.1 hypothetical protein RX330_10090 [Bradyrhizobium sp. NDS-1]